MVEVSKKWRVWIIVLLIGIGSVLAYGVGLLNQNIDKVSEVSESNNRFLVNFSDYLQCLIIRDEAKYQELGKEAYYAMCDNLLFRGTGIKPD